MSKLRLLILLIPFALVYIFAGIGKMPLSNDSVMLFFVSLIGFYLITIWVIVSCAKNMLFNPWLLLVSFVLSPVASYIHDTTHPKYSIGESANYTLTILVVLFYALPFLIVSAVVATMVPRRKETGGTKNQD